MKAQLDALAASVKALQERAPNVVDDAVIDELKARIKALEERQDRHGKRLNNLEDELNGPPPPPPAVADSDRGWKRSREDAKEKAEEEDADDDMEDGEAKPRPSAPGGDADAPGPNNPKDDGKSVFFKWRDSEREPRFDKFRDRDWHEHCRTINRRFSDYGKTHRIFLWRRREDNHCYGRVSFIDIRDRDKALQDAVKLLDKYSYMCADRPSAIGL